jgi:hypothetical protein
MKNKVHCTFQECGDLHGVALCGVLAEPGVHHLMSWDSFFEWSYRPDAKCAQCIRAARLLRRQAEDK